MSHHPKHIEAPSKPPPEPPASPAVRQEIKRVRLVLVIGAASWFAIGAPAPTAVQRFDIVAALRESQQRYAQSEMKVLNISHGTAHVAVRSLMAS